MGPVIALGAEDTIQGYQMAAFYARPPVAIEDVVPVMRSHQRRDGDVACVKEVYRRTRPRSPYFPEVLYPYLDRVALTFNKDGVVTGAVAVDQQELEEGGTLTVTSPIEALRTLGVPLTRKRSDKELQYLLEKTLRIFGPRTEFARRTKRNNTIERILDMEDAFRVVELLDSYGDDLKAREAIYTLSHKTGKKSTRRMFYHDYGPEMGSTALSAGSAYEFLLQLCDSKEELLQAASIVRDKNHLSWMPRLHHAYFTLMQDTATAGDDPTKFLWEKPLANHVYALGRDLIKIALFHHDDPGFREDYLEASFQALYDTLNTLHNIDLPARLTKEQDMYQGLSDFATMNAGDAITLSLIAPVVEAYFLEKLKRIIPGEFDQAREYFYHAIGNALNTHANEATGDDQLQLSLLEDVFKELTERGYWQDGYILQDAGSGDGQRILRPFLESSIMQHAPPGRVYAVDADPYPQPSNGQWIAAQQKFEDSDYPTIHARQQGKEGIESIDAIVEVWSSPTDLDAVNQQRMFRNFSESLRKRDEELPGGILVLELPVGYIQEMITEAEKIGSREMGRTSYDFPLGGGKTLEKKLEIMLPHSLLIRAMRAGFRPLNLPPGKGEIGTPAFYRTRAGKDRAIFVFERVGDPELTLDLAVLADGQVRVGSGKPGRLI